MDQDTISLLLDSYLKQQATAEERAALALWIEEAGEEEQLLLLEGAWSRFEDREPMREEHMQAILTGILGEKENRKRPVYIRGWFRWAAAACIVLLALGSYWIWKEGKVPIATAMAVVSRPAVSEVRPGGNKAVLTLGNGSTIILDSAANGLLAEQGKTRVSKQRDGALTYEAAGRGVTAAVTYNTLTTPRGGQYQVRLPDGTMVWLNAASSITYPTAFTGKSRKVMIMGEAYFEVAPDHRQPFEVETGSVTVEVLGTHFNINAYANEAYVGTTLLEGSVRLRTGNASMVLHPGQQGLAEHAAGSGGSKGRISLAPYVNMEQVMAWKNGLFFFNHADIMTVMRQLSRWYDVEVEYQGSLPARDFRGKIQRDLQLAQVLKFLEQSDVHFTLTGKKIIVRP